jgi:hypothetical protein
MVIFAFVSLCLLLFDLVCFHFTWFAFVVAAVKVYGMVTFAFVSLCFLSFDLVCFRLTLLY